MKDILLSIYFAWSILGSFLYIGATENNSNTAFEYHGPVTKYVYETSSMNILGSFIVALLYYIVFPMFILRSACMIIHWLFHVGRKP